MTFSKVIGQVLESMMVVHRALSFEPSMMKFFTPQVGELTLPQIFTEEMMALNPPVMVHCIHELGSFLLTQ
jgi:hypothetical protein